MNPWCLRLFFSKSHDQYYLKHQTLHTYIRGSVSLFKCWSLELILNFLELTLKFLELILNFLALILKFIELILNMQKTSQNYF